MKRYEQDEINSHDMPHEHIMDERDIEFDELSASIQTDMRHFDNIYKEALTDGYIDDQEEKELITVSYKIAERIRKEHLYEEPPKGSGGLMGIFAGIGIAVVTVFGINQIRKQ